MTNVVFLAPAEEEMQPAAAYYERQRRGLGHEFLVEVQRTVERIVENPRLRSDCSWKYPTETHAQVSFWRFV